MRTVPTPHQISSPVIIGPGVCTPRPPILPRRQAEQTEGAVLMTRKAGTVKQARTGMPPSPSSPPLPSSRPSSTSPSSLANREASIIERVRAIPEGFVRTYADIDRRAPRVVGRVLATTREDLPWHRVVRSDGTVAKGERQRRLLRREGVPFRGDRVDLAQVRVHE